MVRFVRQVDSSISNDSGVSQKIATAERICRSYNRPLTRIQRHAYLFLLQANAPQTAYQILDGLRQSGASGIYPQTVYRTLSSLQESGLVHKLESTNAFLPCVKPARPHESIHLLCEICGCAEELVDGRVSDALLRDAHQRRFKIQRQVVELRGVCAACIRTGAN